MSLVVENGTGLSTAESYASVAQADTRMSGLGNTNWATLSTAEKEEALRRATGHMEQVYRLRWRGTRLSRAQALSWPRYGACADGYDIPSTEVPGDIVNGCIDFAFRAASGDLAPDLERGIVREKVGSLETEYDAYGSQSVRYVALDRLLAPYLKGAPGMARLIRA